MEGPLRWDQKGPPVGEWIKQATEVEWDQRLKEGVGSFIIGEPWKVLDQGKGVMVQNFREDTDGSI
jgi:hypothetical protein